MSDRAGVLLVNLGTPDAPTPRAIASVASRMRTHGY